MGRTFTQVLQSPPQLKRRAIEIPEFGGEFYLNELTGLEQQQLLRENQSRFKGDASPGETAMYASLLSKCLRDEEGGTLSYDQWLALGNVLVRRLGLEAAKLNVVTQDERETLEKN